MSAKSPPAAPDATNERSRAIPRRARWLTSPEAANYLGLNARWLKRARDEGRGPRHSRFGRLVRYDVLELDRWAEAQKVGAEERESS